MSKRKTTKNKNRNRNAKDPCRAVKGKCQYCKRGYTIAWFLDAGYCQTARCMTRAMNERL